MAKKKQVTEIRDDVFFHKLLDKTKNAVFIGWSGIYRKEYQALLKENLPHLRELSIITNAGFESTNISVALYVFSEVETDSYISRYYDGDTAVHEETFLKSEMVDTVEYVKGPPMEKEDLRPKMSDFFKTICDYHNWEAKQRSNRRLEQIKAWERGEGPDPWEEVKEERVDWEKGGNAMLSHLSFTNYLKSVQHDLAIFELFGDTSILYTLRENLLSLHELGRKVDLQLSRLEEFEKSGGTNDL